MSAIASLARAAEGSQSWLWEGKEVGGQGQLYWNRSVEASRMRGPMPESPGWKG